MPSTDLAHCGIGLRACYAMSGTDVADGRSLWPPPPPPCRSRRAEATPVRVRGQLAYLPTDLLRNA
eukprot:1241179-Rhodomonas_salina.2